MSASSCIIFTCIFTYLHGASRYWQYIKRTICTLYSCLANTECAGFCHLQRLPLLIFVHLSPFIYSVAAPPCKCDCSCQMGEGGDSLADWVMDHTHFKEKDIGLKHVVVMLNQSLLKSTREKTQIAKQDCMF